MEGGAARVFAGYFPHGQHPQDSVLARAVEHAANLDSAALQPLKAVRHHLADFFDDHQRVFDVDRALRYHPRSDFRVAHVDTLAAPRPGTSATPFVFSES